MSQSASAIALRFLLLVLSLGGATNAVAANHVLVSEDMPHDVGADILLQRLSVDHADVGRWRARVTNDVIRARRAVQACASLLERELPLAATPSLPRAFRLGLAHAGLCSLASPRAAHIVIGGAKQLCATGASDLPALVDAGATVRVVDAVQERAHACASRMGGRHRAVVGWGALSSRASEARPVEEDQSAVRDEVRVLGATPEPVMTGVAANVISGHISWSPFSTVDFVTTRPAFRDISESSMRKFDWYPMPEPPAMALEEFAAEEQVDALVLSLNGGEEAAVTENALRVLRPRVIMTAPASRDVGVLAAAAASEAVASVGQVLSEDEALHKRILAHGYTVLVEEGKWRVYVFPQQIVVSG